jgi:hypothetical protein
MKITLPCLSPATNMASRELSTSSSPVARRLQALNIGFVLLNTDKVNERFLTRSAFFRNPIGALRSVWSDEDMMFFQMHAATALE